MLSSPYQTPNFGVDAPMQRTKRQTRREKQVLPPAISTRSLGQKVLMNFGFGFMSRLGAEYLLTFYRESPRVYVLGLSRLVEPRDYARAREALGAEVTGEDVAPFAARRFENIGLQDLKGVLTSSFPDVEFEWHRED